MKPLLPSPSPHAEDLERLTHHALHAFNRAIEIELVYGKGERITVDAWHYYRQRLTFLGKATNQALEWQKAQKDKRRPYKSCIRGNREAA